METKTIVVLVVVAVIAYIAGARYPQFAGKLGASGG